MSSTSKIEFHHVFPKAKVLRRYGPALTNSLANLAFISGATNKAIGAKNPEMYLPKIHPDRLVEQWVPGSETWHLDDFVKFLTLRRQAQAAALNDLLGLPPHVAGLPRGDDAELPVDDDEVTADEED